jgi:asparagine synthetase B (glutamine-hydrolysing)
MNSEIYNHQEIRNQCKGIIELPTTSDSVAIGYLYQKY